MKKTYIRDQRNYICQVSRLLTSLEIQLGSWCVHVVKQEAALT